MDRISLLENVFARFVVSTLVEDPIFGTGALLRKFREHLAISDVELLDLMAAGGYKPEGVVRIARSELKVPKDVLAQWAESRLKSFGAADAAVVSKLLDLKKRETKNV